MTYNVHSCIGTDGRLSIERIAQVVASYAPDVVCLQELDVKRQRTGGADQVAVLADLLKMEFHFHPALRVAEEEYGDAVLSRLPLKLIRRDGLPGLSRRPELEPRGAVWVEVEFSGVQIQLFNTHLGLVGQERDAQISSILGSDWIGHEKCHGAVIFCGDLNALPTSRVYRKLRTRLRDAQLSLVGKRPGKTFPSRFAVFRIDHVFVSDHFEVMAAYIPKSPLARTASDHLPLVVDLRVPTR